MKINLIEPHATYGMRDQYLNGEEPLIEFEFEENFTRYYPISLRMMADRGHTLHVFEFAGSPELTPDQINELLRGFGL